METIRKIYKATASRLSAAGIDNAFFDAACIIEKHTGVSRVELPLLGNSTPTCDQEALYSDIARRENHEPLQYILGVWPFYGLDFFVGSGVLIPRQETELLAETAIDFLKNRQAPKFLELCAGGGCLSTAVLKHVENSAAVCVELSADAAGYLKKNIDAHDLTAKAEIVRADVLLSKTVGMLGEKYGLFDAILCNPPYIRHDEVASLMPEVAGFEPHMALDGGEDGLVFYRALGQYLPLLKNGGMAAFEIGMGQSSDVTALLKESGLCNIFIKKDLSGIERTVGGFAAATN